MFFDHIYGRGMYGSQMVKHVFKGKIGRKGMHMNGRWGGYFEICIQIYRMSLIEDNFRNAIIHIYFTCKVSMYLHMEEKVYII